jgi:long-subunit fatty acid transport protein
MTKIIFGGIYYFLLIPSCFSQSVNPDNEYFFNPFWDIYSKNYLSAKNAGKGYTGIAGDNDLSGTILNPASLTQSSMFEVYGEYIYKSEVPFQKFDNDNYFEELNPSMLAGISYRINKDINIAALYENNNGFRLKFPVYNKFGERTNEEFNYDLSISSISLPVVYAGAKMLRFGINFRYSFYSLQLEGLPEYNFSESFQKFVPDFGIVYEPINNLSIGAVFTPEASENVEVVRKDTSFTYADANIFPLKFGFGINYTFAKTPLTLSADYTFTNTSTDENLNDRNDFNFGLEYSFNRNVTIRSGIFVVKDFRNLEEAIFIYTSNPGSYSQTFGTLGGTINIKKLNLNLSVIDSHIFSSGNITQTQVNFGMGYNF